MKSVYRLTLIALAALCSIAGIQPVQAYSTSHNPSIPPNFELVEQWGGALNTMAIQDHYGYLGEGLRLKILDLTPDEEGKPAMSIVGESDVLPGVVTDIVVNGSFAYVMAGGLQVLDISDVSHPKVHADFAHIHNEPWMRMQLDGTRLYVQESDLRWNVYDVSNPGTLVWVAAYSTDGIMRFNGRYAYAIDQDSPPELVEFQVYELNEPTSTAELIGTYSFSRYPSIGVGSGSPMAFDDDYVYLVANHRCSLNWTCIYLVILDVASPEQPQLRSITQPDWNGWGARDIEVVNGRAYIIEADERAGSLYLYDVSNPDNPMLEAHYYEGDLELPHQVFVDGNHVYVLRTLGYYYYESRHIRNINVYQISDQDEEIAITLVNLYVDDGYALGMYIQGEHAYAITDQGVTTLDISNPLHPNKLGRIRTPLMTRRIQVFGKTAGVVVARRGQMSNMDDRFDAYLYDLSDPDAPQLLVYDWIAEATSYMLPSLSLAGDRLYVSYPLRIQHDWLPRIRIFDVSDPPMLISLGGWQQFPQDTQFLHFENDYVLLEKDSLKILDTSNPMTPTIAAEIPVSGEVKQVIADALTASIWTQMNSLPPYQYQLRVFDITDRSQPVEDALYIVEQSSPVEFIEIEGNKLYVTSYDRLETFEMNSTGELELLSSQPIVPAPNALSYRTSRTSDLFYYPAQAEGLLILRSSPRIWMPLVFR
ncbi:MAG: hypothetical protein GY759_17430 [Chloroflexi bacterium]|nr:hypothetical protein [Chloroflexota bacterium]